MGVRAGGIDTVEGSLRAYVTPETLDGDNQWQCSDEPVRRVDALKGISFQRFPRLLTLHLKRFVFDYATMRRRKLNDVLRFGETLDVGEFMGAGSGDGDGDGDGAAGEGGGGDSAGTRYELFAILIHSGSAGGGHYYSYIKDLLPAAPPAEAAAPSPAQCGGGAVASASAGAAAGSDGVASGWSSYNDAHVRQLDASSLQMMMSGTATSSTKGSATAAAGGASS
eukprot:COSAG01_NODE_8983_length_2594_cov_9.563527_3_plen_224_part_00